MTLGRGRWRVFWTVTAPLAWPALLAGGVLAWRGPSASSGPP